MVTTDITLRREPEARLAVVLTKSRESWVPSGGLLNMARNSLVHRGLSIEIPELHVDLLYT